jgi:hypothetical protein
MFYSDARNATNVSATPVFGDITLENIVVHDAQPTGKDGWCGKTEGCFQILLMFWSRACLAKSYSSDRNSQNASLFCRAVCLAVQNLMHILFAFNRPFEFTTTSSSQQN